MISVIVPVYKVEKYLSQCIDSILNQTYRDFELILVDDGSPDRCGEICDRYAAQDDRIKVVHQANGGFSAARNAGIDLASGEFLTFVDSDDYLHEEALEALHRSLVENDADFSMGYHEKVSETGEPIPEPISQVKDEVLSGREVLLNNMYFPLFYIVPWNKLFKRELFSDIRFPLGKCHEDIFILYKLIYKSSKIARVPRILYYYRQNPNGFMALGVTLEKSFCNLEALIERMEFFEKHDLCCLSEGLSYYLLNTYFILRTNFSLTDPAYIKRFRAIKRNARFFIYKYRKHFKAKEIICFESFRLFKFLSFIKKGLLLLRPKLSIVSKTVA